MAGLYEKQAEAYAQTRPTYPREWFSKLASLTSGHSLAWDAGTGNGQAAISVSLSLSLISLISKYSLGITRVQVAEHYEQVIATDISESQLKHATPHPKVKYIHTPPSTTETDLIELAGGEGSVDLVIAATAAHWFDLPTFYSAANRLLKKPGGIIAVWGYNHEIHPLEEIMQRFYSSLLPFLDPRAKLDFERYRNLSFPFESVGLGSEGNPVDLEMEMECSLEEFVGMLRTWSAVGTAKKRGVDLVSERVVREIEAAWGSSDNSNNPGVRTLTYKTFMLAGRPLAHA